jgi:thioredoxin-dependent peroxiredoxin
MNIGDEVPDFTATLDDGQQTTLTDLLADGPIVLFFYPKAFTGGCTAEACYFRDLGSEFTEVGAQRVGISADDVATQASFRDKHDFDYPLIADTSGEIATIFGTKRIGPLPPKRHTFVIGTDRRLLAAIRSETDMEAHADEALQVLRSA